MVSDDKEEISTELDASTAELSDSVEENVVDSTEALAELDSLLDDGDEAIAREAPSDEGDSEESDAPLVDPEVALAALDELLGGDEVEEEELLTKQNIPPIPSFAGSLVETIPLEPLPQDVALANLREKAAFVRQDVGEPIIRSVYRCYVGAIRARNEDSCLVFVSKSGGQEPMIPFGLFIVADGMGGHHAGHEASKQVSRLVGQKVLQEIYLPLLSGTHQGPQRPIQEVMLDAVQAANKALYNPDPEKDSGTTLTAALIFGRRIYVAHVGDSRAYIMKDGALKKITVDHSYVQRLIDTGQITPEEAEVHPHRNVLYRAVGQGGRLDVDSYTQSLPVKGRLMLCSDGLWGLVSDEEMSRILEDQLTLQEKADLLVEKAMNAGGHDNITTIIIEFEL